MALRILYFVPSLLVLLTFSTLQPTEAVINGLTADSGEFPFAVDIRNASDSVPYCGGTLVTRRHIVTSMVCVTTPEHLISDSPPTLLPLESVKVYVGDIGARKGQRYEVESIVGHPDYNVNVSLVLNNLAVIKLKKEVNVKVASLSTVKPKVGEKVEVAGWGYTDLNETNPATNLQKLTSRVVDAKECKKKWEELGSDYSVIYSNMESDKLFCALPVAKDSAVGFGDLGGPAIANHQYVGFPTNRLLSNLTIPLVFEAVGAYKDFIDGVINAN